MKVLQIIPAQRWRNLVTGQTASVYGAVPYHGTDEQDWVRERCGFTWLNANGTVGLGRAPAETLEEALNVMAKVNAR